jgi:hypothetical protein
MQSRSGVKKMYRVGNSNMPFAPSLMMVLLVAAVAVCGVRPTPAAGAGAITVRAFYASTSQEYDRWSRNSSTAPRSYGSFPSGLKQLALYFSYTGAGRSSGYYLVLRRQDGTTIDVAGFNKMTKGSGEYMDRFSLDRRLPNGGYSVDLVVDDRLLSTLSVAIGFGLIPNDGLLVTSFYPISVAAKDGWKDYTLPPPATTSFPAGTPVVYTVLLYTGAKPDATYRVLVRNWGQYAPLYTPKYPASFPKGRYSASLMVGDEQVAQTRFTIG